MNASRSALLYISISAGVVATPALYAQDPPAPPPAVPADATTAYGHGTTGEVVYNLSYDPLGARFYGQQRPGYAEDLHLTRAGDLVCFTISVYNGSSNVFSPAFGPGTYDPIDALVQFYDAAPVSPTGFDPSSLLAEYHVPIPAPDSPNGTVWTVTTDLTTPVAVPQDIWVYVTTPGANGTQMAYGQPLTYAGPLFHPAPVSPDVGTTNTGIWIGAPFNIFYPPYDYRQAVTIRLSEGNEPPVVTCGTPAVMWSPNHEFVDVSGNLFTIDDPDTLPEDLTVDVRVVSDENEIPETGDGTGKHAPDFKTQLANGANGFFLRSERRGPGDGRVYLVVVTVSDGFNTVTQVCVAAVTPHDQTTESMMQVLSEADARAADLQAEIDLVGVGNVDLAAMGLYEHGLSGQLGPKQ